MKHSGYIYILTNPSFPDFVKLGYSDNIQLRLKQLNRSEASPFAFRIYATYETDSRLTDIELHNLIDILNPGLRAVDIFDGKKRVKEFYAMSKEDAFSILRCIAKISGTEDKLKRLDPEGHEIIDEEIAEEIREKSRRDNFRFAMCGIEEGELIQFVNDPSLEIKVADDKRVEYNGETMSLSALAQRLMNSDSQLQEPKYFHYQGKPLTELREKYEM